MKHKDSKKRDGSTRWIIIAVILSIAAGLIYYYTASDRHSLSSDGSHVPSTEVGHDKASPGTDGGAIKQEGQKSVTRPIAGDIKVDTLIGRWYRTDGEYMIQVTDIAADGKAQAEYFNPRPINVSKAEAYTEQPPRLFIELQDAGYDGSNYNLTYDAQNDVLSGNYYQATYGQTYSVIFMRGAK